MAFCTASLIAETNIEVLELWLLPRCGWAAPFWGRTQRRVVIPSQRFGTELPLTPRSFPDERRASYNVKSSHVNRSAWRPTGENNFMLHVQPIFTFEILWTVVRLWPSLRSASLATNTVRSSIRYAAMSRSGDQANLLLCRESNPVLSFVMLRSLNLTSKFHRAVWGLPQNSAESDVGTGGCARVVFRYCPLAPC